MSAAQEAIKAARERRAAAQMSVSDAEITADPTQVEALRQQAGVHGKQGEGAQVGQALATLDFRVNQYGRLCYGYRTPSGRFEVLDAESPATLDAIALLVRAATGRTPSHEVLKRELAPIRAMAREQGRKVHIYNRIAPDGSGGYIIDIGDTCGTVVAANASGWTTHVGAQTAFRRGGGYGELAIGVRPSSVVEAWGLVTSWLESKGVPRSLSGVVAVLLCEWLRPDTPNPVLEILGTAGSGKTTLANQLAALVDPTESGILPSTRLTEPDAAAAASNRYVLGYDNAGGPLKDAEQDLVCKVSTGTVFAARLLYTQADEFQVGVRAPIIITAIVPVLTRADARSRTVQLKIRRRAGVRSAVDVAQAFEAERGGLTAASLTLLAAGLAGLPAARSQSYTHRLADFDQLGEAITAAVGWQPGQFREVMADHRREVAHDAALGNPVVDAVRKILDDLGAKAAEATARPRQADWIKRGGEAIGYAYIDAGGLLRVGVTLKHLHSHVRALPGDHGYQTERSSRNALDTQAPNLEAIGITYATAKVRTGAVIEFRTGAGGRGGRGA